MKTFEQWVKEYAVSHQHPTNKIIHYFCVPLIYFSIVGWLMSIPFPFFIEERSSHPLLFNWATVALVLVMFFYLRLSWSVALEMFVFSLACLLFNQALSHGVPLWLSSLLIFSVAWIGQFYGHHIEGKKPSFLKDLQFLLIGPAWVIHQWLPHKKG